MALAVGVSCRRVDSMGEAARRRRRDAAASRPVPLRSGRSGAANRVHRHAPAATESRAESCYELTFVTPPRLDELLLEGPSEEANDALAALAIIVDKTASDLPPICLTCARVFAHDLPAAVAIAKPFASQSGEMIVAAVCEDCLDHGREILIAKILERFRASGMRDARELKVGTA